ncbi:MAG TPA: NADH-quinone oxidoreductase subunit L [Gemmataceae bacterium]
MSEGALIWLIPGLPLLAAALAGALGWTRWRAQSHWPVVVAVALSCAAAFYLAPQVGGDNPVIRTAGVTWFAAGDLDVTMRLAVDPLTGVMLTAITFVGLWIAVFSIGYMRGESGYGRYFALISLFVAAMTGLVLAENFLVLFLCWEGVGVCSYLLVGYWYAKPSAAAAARKAFLVTRLGDVGLLLGIFLLWSVSGYQLEFRAVFERLTAVDDPFLLATACLLIFCGAVGKSAQFPLYVWLPDAMEGPTPVSALIHAATMVTAGVYLLARCVPLFILSPAAQATVATLGAVTALMAAYVALTQTDLKRVLAYSTVSQLGFMFLALGAGVGGFAAVGVTAALFHLFTHAFFKGVLFLSAGSVMHSMGNVIDMRRFSGLRSLMPVTHLAFLAGALALAGIPPLSGFVSKEAIFGVVVGAAEQGSAYRALFGLLLVVGLLAAGLTAFYTFRAYFKTFWGPLRTPEEAGEHPHESSAVMLAPLVVLALGALFVGLVAGPLTHWFSGYLSATPAFDLANRLAGVEPAEHHGPPWLMIAGIAVALAGAGVAWWMYRAPSDLPDRAAERLRPAYALSKNELYLDDLYQVLFVRPFETLAFVGRQLDGLVDGVVRLVSAIPGGIGRLLQPIQIGLVQFYALAMALGLVVFLGFLVFRAAQ